MKAKLQKINDLFELYTEAERRRDYHYKEADKYIKYSNDIGREMYLRQSQQAQRYSKLSLYIYKKFVKATKALTADLPEDKLIYQFNIDGHLIDINNERQADKLAQSYPNAHVKITDWLTGALIDEAEADAIFNVEPKEHKA